MLEIFTSLLYIKKNLSDRNFILINSCSRAKLLTRSLSFRRYFPNKSKNCCFLIDGKKTNTKKSLEIAMTNICKFSNEGNGKKPFSIVIIINLKHILLENQLIFKKFLSEKSMVVRFYFLTNDLNSLNKYILTQCNIIHFKRPNKNKNLFNPPKSPFFQYLCGINREEWVKISSSDEKIFANLFFGNINFKQNTIKIKNMIFKFSKKYSNEAFILFLFTYFYEKKKKFVQNILSILFSNRKNFTKDIELYKLIILKK